jgi:glycosyltransferase involved in cell wall biosynthesis
MKFGFRSCFNFIPEGSYRVPAELRDWLTSRGFEVGVHDLKHDGRLFRSREEFGRHVLKINSYLHDWQATGFRAGFMLNEPDWLHDLEIRYDCSTFDTDPFEPQPNGQNTIFPFWVPNPNLNPNHNLNPNPSSNTHSQNPEPGTRNSESETRNPELGTQHSQPGTRNSELGTPKRGYVELPYTLPQDSTLFLLLNENSPAIWLQKLDWIAAHGGMALVNVHPDYVHLDGGKCASRTYSVDFYRRLLEHARTQTDRTCWQPLPRQVADFVNTLSSVPLRRKPRRICMVTHSHYNTDGRVTRYAEALAEQGDEVEIFSLRSSPGIKTRETVRGVNVHRIQDRFGKRERSQLSFILPVLRFFLVSTFWITRGHARRRYDLVHVHNIPDFLVFAAWYPKLTGARLILDIHDVVPEFYASKFAANRARLVLPLLKLMERWSARFAHHVIIANDLWVNKYSQRTGANGKCSVFINNVDARIFAPRPRTRQDGRAIIMFPGGLQWHQGLDIAIRAFRRILAATPRAEFHIYGDGNMKESLVALSQELGLNGSVRFFDPLPVRDIAGVMANADLGVVPKRADSFGDEAYSTKIMEFMSLGVPVVVSSTRIDRHYFDDTVVRFFESGNPEALADAALEVIRNDSLRRGLISRASTYAARYSWENRKQDYLNLVDNLCSR